MERLKFSAFMCVYEKDNPKHFKEALNSVYNQTRLPDEMIIVVDGPVGDEINEVISYFEQEKNACVYRLEKNMGHGIARNTGINKCKYDYVAACDADDIYTHDRFEKQIACFEEDDKLSAVSSYSYHFSGDISNIISQTTLPTENEEIKKIMKIRSPLCQSSAMMKKSDVEKAGGFLDWYYAEDYYLWVRMYLNGAVFKNVAEKLIYVRSDDEQAKRRGGMKYFKSLRKLYKFMLKNNVINYGEYLFNVATRFVMQILLPTKLRGYIRKKFH